jgi:hypothetical protein
MRLFPPPDKVKQEPDGEWIEDVEKAAHDLTKRELDEAQSKLQSVTEEKRLLSNQFAIYKSHSEQVVESLTSEVKRLKEQQVEAVDIEKMLTHAVILGQNNIDQNGNYVGYGVEETVKGVMNYFKCSLTQSKSTQ